METILKNKAGQYKDFTALSVAWDIKYGTKGKMGVVYSAIVSASITAGLKKLTKKQEREIIYSSDYMWLKVIEQLA